MPNPLVLVCSVERFAPILPSILDRTSFPFGPVGSGWKGSILGRPVIAIAGGMGKTNAGHSLTAVLERVPAAAVIGFGVAGCYAGSGLAPGDVALALREVYGDEGVEAPEGWISCDGIGIPLVETPSGRLFNSLPVDEDATRRAAGSLAVRKNAAPIGTFVTVSACSGTAARGRKLAERFGAICETMEGAAYAHVAVLYGLPFVEIRGISNVVEDRDLKRWKLQEAAVAAADAVVQVVGSWKDIPAVATRLPREPEGTS